MMKPRALLVATVLATVAVPSSSLAAQSPDGYLLGQPRVSFVLKGIFDRPEARGDVYDFTTSLLTLDRSDFQSFGGGFQVNVRVVDALDLSFEGGGTGSSAHSEFIDFVEVIDGVETPIRQRTTLSRQTWAASARFFPLSRGRRIGNFAWVPRSFTPYLGGGVGHTRYRLVQEGDFVDEDDLSIFTDYFQTEENGATTHAFIGADVGLGARFFVNTEGRWTWGDAPVTGDFVGFDDLDLSAFQFSLGIGVRL